MSDDILAAALAAYQGKRCTANEFLRQAKPAFRAIASHAMRRWVTPLWLEVADVEQEVMLAAWIAVGKYSAELGALNAISIRGYVVYNAYAAAKKRIHKARLGHRPHRGEESAKSRFELTASSFIVKYNDDGNKRERGDPIECASVPAGQDEATQRRLLFERVARSADGPRNIRVLYALAEVAGESVEAAGLALYSDLIARELYGLKNADAAIRLVSKVVADVAESSWAERAPDSERAA